MSIRLKDTIYNTANYSTDSDKLDGYDSSHYMQYKSASTPATAQWYRIAQTGSGISNNIGIFEIYGSTSSYHTDVILEAGTSYGITAGTTLVQTSCAAYSNMNLTKARIVYHTSYSGNYAYLEVYLNCSAVTTIYVKFQGHGWTLVAPSTVGSIPSGYSTKEITFTKDAVVAKTFVGALSGNASTATSATTATSAEKLTTARTISLTGSVTGSGSFDGSGNLSIATTTNHSHSYASKVTVGSTAYSVSSNNITIPAYPTSLKCPNSLTIQGNGSSLGSYDGSAAKTINITPAAIGAAASGHTHDYAANYQKTCTVSNTNGSSAWYTILSVGDSTNSPVLVSVRAYAHSSITFIACKGYRTSGSINVLNYCASENGSYPYVKGVRLLSDGKVQVYLNSPTTLSGDKKIQVNVFCTGSVTITTTLTYETGSPTVIAEPTLNDRGISTLGNITAAKFVKSGSSDSYLLLGAGGSKAVSDFATSGHTHNYAGSSSAGGSATSANKLATARKITLSGSVTGSADFDGSAAITISTTTNHTHSYAGSSSAGGAATSANKLNTNAGDSRSPVYFSSGVPVACNNLDLRKYYSIDASSLSTSNFYPVTFASSDIMTECEIHSPNLDEAQPYNQNVIHFQLIARGWSDTPKSFKILHHGVHSGSEITIGAIGSGNEGGMQCVWVRGGMLYRFYCNKTPTLRTANTSNGNEIFTVGTNYSGGSNTKVTIHWSYGQTGPIVCTNSHTHSGYLTSLPSHTHDYLPTAGGNMTSGARIAANGGNLYIGNSNNAGWLMVQNICSQNSAGDTYWSLRTNGAAHFTTLYLGGEQITFTT